MIRRGDPTHRLLRWYDLHGRTFPWRTDPSPWQVLVASVLLRQTQAMKATPVFNVLISKYPTPYDMAAADEEFVTTAFRPLGLPQRGRLLIEAARQIIEEFDGEVPTHESDLRGLPGVGAYIAQAVRCFALGERVVIVDTVTGRVISRLMGLAENKQDPALDSDVIAAADNLAPKRRPADFSYALLDIGALYCRPRPRCAECPLQGSCAHAARN